MLAIIIFGDKNPVAQIVRDYGPILPIAFGIAFLVTPLCRKIALRLGMLDMPDQGVKTHKEPTAYLGGVAILTGLLAGLGVGIFLLCSHQIHIPVGSRKTFFDVDYPNWLILVGVGFGAVIACVVGILDDIFDIKPRQKFLGQIVAALVLIAVGVRPNLNHLFHTAAFLITNRDVTFDIPVLLDFFLGIPIVIFFILGATNSLNLLDGLDGLCAGVTAIITTAFALLAIILASWGYSDVGDPVRLILCLALVGSTLGFLPMNRHPARIFMGDAGSMLLGFVAGTLMLLFSETFGWWTVACIIIFGLPILDTAVALVRRFVNKRPLFVSDRGHIYDQLMDRGNTLGTTVTISYLLAGLYALIGLAVCLTRFRFALVIFFVVAVVSAVVVWRGDFLRMDSSASKPETNTPTRNE
jgi:UDP-GlcNAc:undecaprenyl-phosphate/decaprenyl-phosphate GlcNAc-1-phosphate transferase